MWDREPSIEVCAVECGAKCCREPGYLPIALTEIHRLKHLFPDDVTFRTTIKNEGGTHWLEDTGHVYIVFAENGGQCPNLADDNSCSIWVDRPQACQDFPARPHDGCLVWSTPVTATE